MGFNLSQLIGRDLVWLLDFTYAGQVFRLARGFETYTDEDGDDHEYQPGLEWGGTLEDEIALLSDAPSPNQVGLTLHLGDLINVPEHVALGHDLAAATGKLYIWARGTSERQLLIDGRVLDPQYGAAHQPVTLSIEEAPFDDLALFPPATAQINATTWPTHADGTAEERYPWIFGAPGQGTYGSPGLWIENNKLLIAGHPTTGGADVHVWNLTNFDIPGASGQRPVIVETDGLGREVSRVGVGTLSNKDAANEYWIEWLPGEATGQADHDQTAILGAGSVLRFMMEQSDVRWDRGRIAAILPALNLYRIDTAIVVGPGARFSPLAWVQDHLSPILPISARQGPHGLYYSLFHYDADSTSAVAEISVERGDAVREGAVSYSPVDSIANEIRLSYAPNAKDNKSTALFILTGDDDTLDTEAGSVSNAPCRVSRDRFGLRVLELSTDVIYDRSTAGRICSWLSFAFALPSRTIAYVAAPEFGHLEPGDVVTISDSEIYLDQLVCLVDSVTWTESGSIGLVLRAIDNPARESFGG